MFNDVSGGSARRVRFFGVAVVGSEGGGCSHFLFSFSSLRALPIRGTARRVLSGAAVECREGSSLLREMMVLTSTSGAAWDEGMELAGCQRIFRLLCGCLP